MRGIILILLLNSWLTNAVDHQNSIEERLENIEMRLEQLATDLHSNMHRNNDEISNKILRIALVLQNHKNETEQAVIAIKDEIKSLGDKHKVMYENLNATRIPTHLRL